MGDQAGNERRTSLAGGGRLRRFGWAAVAAVLALMLASCGGDDAGDEEDSQGTTTEATQGTPDPTDPDEPLTPEDEVLAAYMAAVDALAAANAEADPEHPDLLAHWAPPALTHIQASVENYRLNGRALIVESQDHNPVVQIDSEDPDLAWVVVCITDMSYEVDAETREPVDGMPGEEAAFVMESKDKLRRIDGTWVVVENEYQEADGCTPG